MSSANSLYDEALSEVKKENTYKKVQDFMNTKDISADSPGEINLNISVKPDDDLKDTLSRMLEAGEHELPVVNRQQKLVGTIRLMDIFNEMKK